MIMKENICNKCLNSAEISHDYCSNCKRNTELKDHFKPIPLNHTCQNCQYSEEYSDGSWHCHNEIEFARRWNIDNNWEYTTPNPCPFWVKICNYDDNEKETNEIERNNLLNEIAQAIEDLIPETIGSTFQEGYRVAKRDIIDTVIDSFFE